MLANSSSLSLISDPVTLPLRGLISPPADNPPNPFFFFKKKKSSTIHYPFFCKKKKPFSASCESSS